MRSIADVPHSVGQVTANKEIGHDGVPPELLRAYQIEEFKVVHARIDDEYKRYNETFVIVVAAVGAIALGLLAAISSDKITLSRQGIWLVAMLAFSFCIAGCVKAIGHMHRIRRHDYYLAAYLEPALAGTAPTLTRYWFRYARAPLPRDQSERNVFRPIRLHSMPVSLQQLIANGLSANRWALWILLIGLTGTFAYLTYASPDFVESLILKERKSRDVGGAPQSTRFERMPGFHRPYKLQYRSI